MQFVVTAWDFRDPDAINRRLEHREKHLAGVKELIAQDSIISVGAILDNNEKMIGSSIHLVFPDRDALETRLNSDPYVIGKVWEKIDIRQIKLISIPDSRPL